MQRKWGELKAEVAYLDRKRRRARRKEREGEEVSLSVCSMLYSGATTALYRVEMKS